MDAAYDYVIVGGGSAGCALAGRLSEDPRARVLLLEAGGDSLGPAFRTPRLWTELVKTEHDWGYHTEPEPQLRGHSMHWAAGRALGGGGAINAMVYVRGFRTDFDAWRDAGNPGWGWDDVLPCFLRAEDQQHGASAWQGTGGPLRVVDPRHVSPLSRTFVAAGREIGLPHRSDFNAPDLDEGVGLFQVTMRDGERESAATAYVYPNLGRPNLSVLTGARATRVLLEGQRAAAVEYLRDGALHTARAEREVILSAGGIGSAHLLLLSGIGPADELRAAGVQVRHELPGVGRGLQNHPILLLALSSNQPISLDGPPTSAQTLEYETTRGGPLASGVAEAGAFLRTRSDLALPDIELVFCAAFYLPQAQEKPTPHGFTIVVILCRPRSRGSVRLRSADPLAPPLVVSGYFTVQSDLETLLAGLRAARRLAAAPAFDPYRGEEASPGVAVRTDAALGEWARGNVDTQFHPSSTCRMGRDELAVVDSRLRVRGMRGLRVADCAIMPTIVSGNTNATAIMIGEKAADLVRADAR